MQSRNGLLKEILLSTAAMAVTISFLGFVAWVYQNGHKCGTFVARESFVLDHFIRPASPGLQAGDKGVSCGTR